MMRNDPDYYKNWYEKNKGRRHNDYMRQREKRLAMTKAWKKAHPEAVKEQKRRHRLRKKQLQTVEPNP